MKDYEEIFATSLHTKLKEKIKGKIYCRIRNDQLYVSIENVNIKKFEVTVDNFATKLIYGFSVVDVANEVISKYTRYVHKYYFY